MKVRYHYDNNFTQKPDEYSDLLLYQLGEMLCDSGNVVDSHTHLNWFEFTFIFSGNGTIYTNNIPTKVSQGDVYVSLPREIHKIVSNDIEPLRFCFCAFNFTETSELFPLLNNESIFRLDKCQRCFHLPHYSGYFQNLLAEINERAEHSNYLLEYELKTVILKILRRINRVKGAAYSPPRINNTEFLCFNVINYIDTHLTTIANLTDLAEIFGYNYAYISRSFKNKTGGSISDYFTNKKLTMAKQLIEESSLSITEIADQLNYSSIYVFSRAFKAKYGLCPNAYKNAVKQKKEE